MINRKLNFKIVPIFNQSVPGVWTDFVNIENVCDIEIYDFTSYAEDLKHKLRNHKSDWKMYKYSFAFGAYYRKEMIGFAKGYLREPDETFLSCLYVLPKYHKMGVGTKLLKMAEKTSSIIANRISLIPLSKAKDFYVLKNDYGYRGDMGKDLSSNVNMVVPVFQWMPTKFHIKFDIDVDNKFLRQNKHQPLFVHINENSRIDGIGIRTVDGKNKIWVNKGDITCRRALLSELSNCRQK